MEWATLSATVCGLEVGSRRMFDVIHHGRSGKMRVEAVTGMTVPDMASEMLAVTSNITAMSSIVVFKRTLV